MPPCTEIHIKRDGEIYIGKHRGRGKKTSCSYFARDVINGKTYFDLIYKLECDLNMKLPLDLKNKLCSWKIIYERTARWKLI